MRRKRDPEDLGHMIMLNATVSFLLSELAPDLLWTLVLCGAFWGLILAYPYWALDCWRSVITGLFGAK